VIRTRRLSTAALTWIRRLVELWSGIPAKEFGLMRRWSASRRWVLWAALGLAGCTSYDLIALPLREAELYPNAYSDAGIAVAAQAFTDPARVQSYFGTNLLAYEVLPVEVTVSNHGDRPIRIEPAGILLLRGDQVVDPLPVELVAELPMRGRFVSRATRKELHAYYADLQLRDAIVAPGTSHHGVMFFRVPEPRSPALRALRIWEPFSMPTLHLFAAVKRDGGEPVRFGPFGLVE
jgi:hypothetical protein